MKCEGCGNEYERINQHYSISECPYPKIDRHSMDVLVGALMGDGTILDNSKNCQMTLTSTNREYLEHVSKILPNELTNSIFLSDKKEDRENPENCKDCYKISFLRHPVFNGMRKTWYNNGKKRFPRTLKLNRTRLRHWYVTDGCLKNRKGGTRDRVKIGNTLEKDDPTLIEDMFEEIGMDIRYDGYTNYRLAANDREKFFDYIGREPIPGFEYKWPDNRNS